MEEEVTTPPRGGRPAPETQVPPDGARVALSPADGRLCAGDGNTDGNITTGFQCWNTKRDAQDQYETFNGMPVYYGGDLYDSEDSDWDDPYALASVAYVEDYNFDVPDGVDLMVHRHSRDPDSLGDCRIAKWMWLLYIRLCHMPRGTSGKRVIMIH